MTKVYGSIVATVSGGVYLIDLHAETRQEVFGGTMFTTINNVVYLYPNELDEDGRAELDEYMEGVDVEMINWVEE
jgi:hypothetical protein